MNFGAPLLHNRNHWLYYLARAAMTKYHRLGGFRDRSIWSHSSTGEKSEIKLLTGLILCEDYEEESCCRPLSLAYLSICLFL